jgi:hypothetical protein
MQVYTKKNILSTDSFDLGKLQGEYLSQGGNYYLNTSSSLLLKICERKQSTVLKPHFYIVQRTQDAKFVFISSLYPQAVPNTFVVEKNRQYFIVTKEGETLNISAK